MAGASAKKAQKGKDAIKNKLNPALLGVNLWYLVIRLLVRYSTTTKWHFFAAFFCVVIYMLTYSMAIESRSAPSGSLPEYFLDILILTLFTQALAALFNKVWYLLLLIPAFATYKAITLFANRPKVASQPDASRASEEPSSSDKKSKKKVMKQRRR